MLIFATFPSLARLSWKSSYPIMHYLVGTVFENDNKVDSYYF